MQGLFRSVWRFFYFACFTAWSIIRFTWRTLHGEDKNKAGLKERRHWLNHVPATMGLRLHVEGIPHPGPCLYVGNHITYIDPIAVLLHLDASVVAKAEVKKWPLVGYAAHIVGTIFVRRDEKDSRRAVASAIEEALANGTSILVYPEGTTSAGPGTLPFRPRSFEAAERAGVAVQPIAILYDAPQAAYIGQDTFLPHFFRLFRSRYITGRIAFGPVLTGENTCIRARQWIEDTQHSYLQKQHRHESA